MARIPLVGSYNTRNNRALPASFDQRFVNFIPQIVTSPVGTTTVYQEKRQGCEIGATPNSGKNGAAILLWTGRDANDSTYITAWTNADISQSGGLGSLAQFYRDTTNITNLGGFDALGASTVKDIFLSETDVSDVATVCFAIADDTVGSINFTGAYYQENISDTTSFTGDLHSNTTVDGIASTANFREGQLVTHANIPAGTRIQSVDSANAITITAAATATAAGQVISVELIAKMLSANIASDAVGGFCHAGGYTFYMTRSGNLRNSALNSVTTWPADGLMPCNVYPDGGVRSIRYRNWIVAFGKSSIEFFANTGGTGSGSPLQRVQDSNFRVGALFARNIASTGDKVAFVGQESASGPVSLYILEGVGYKKLSSPTLNKIMSSVGTPELVIVGFISANGQQVITLNFGLSGSNVMYGVCPDSGNAVFEWAAGTDETPIYATVRAALTSFVTPRNTSGKRYIISPSDTSPQFTDDGVAYTGTLVVGPLFANGNSFIVNRLGIICDRQSSASILGIEVSRDGTISWETVRNLDVSGGKILLHRLGKFDNNGISLRLTHSSNTPFRIEAIDFPDGAIMQLAA